MANLSISEAWNESASFARREAQLLFPVAFLLMALPGAVLQMFAPQPVPGQPPELGLWLAFVPVVIVLSLIGTIAVTHLALRPGSSVGEALQLGARRFLFLLGAVLLIGLGAAALILPLAIIATILGGSAAGTPNPAAIGLLILLSLPVFIFFWVRLALMTPVAAAESGGPIAIIQRSWVLTQGHFWPLLGFLLLFVVVLIVVSLAVGAVGGLLIFFVAGAPEPGSLALLFVMLLSALVNAVVGALFAVVLARIYVQLGGTGRADIFA
jgi:hypothetical protein